MTKTQFDKGLEQVNALAGDAEIWSPTWQTAFRQVFALADESALNVDIADRAKTAKDDAIAEHEAELERLKAGDDPDPKAPR